MVAPHVLSTSIRLACRVAVVTTTEKVEAMRVPCNGASVDHITCVRFRKFHTVTVSSVAATASLPVVSYNCRCPTRPAQQPWAVGELATQARADGQLARVGQRMARSALASARESEREAAGEGSDHVAVR